eukprot:TRINITY_DN2129_c0_g1_i1.p1 TRINITY_DN2129_c0_g1~~TRINITY_DN2129_c0_g1_i1.p1  ORF type:complete len:277 (+),score=22.66 TRINITY_DN2129_c0_g1_i1:58-888(+)
MPLIIMTGFPSAGKSTAAKKIQQYFTEHGKEAEILSEENLMSGDKNSVFASSTIEKEVRGRLKSEVIRLLDKEKTIICDGANYIKGFRYELYCASKASKTTQITVFCDLSVPDVQDINSKRDDNQKYTSEILTALCQRYEAPISSNRWDSPLFLILKDGEFDGAGMIKCLYERAPPPPNQSTQTQPLSNTDFLYQLDKQTQEIVTTILEAQKLSGIGEEISFSSTQEKLVLSRTYTLSELARTKRQFIKYAKERAIQDVEKLASMFVQYLRSNLIA